MYDMLEVVVERTCSSCYDYLVMILLSWMMTMVLKHVHDMMRMVWSRYGYVVVTITTLQNFSLASFWSLPINHP